MSENKKENITKKVFIPIAILIIILFIAIISDQFTSSKQSNASQTINLNMTYATTTIAFPNGTIVAQISDTINKQTQGLSDRTNLPEGTGMLFVFSTPAIQYMWMKDMNFPLDIVWMDANKRVTYIGMNLSPDTYLTKPPQIFYSPTPALYVLELPANDAARLGIMVGTQLEF